MKLTQKLCIENARNYNQLWYWKKRSPEMHAFLEKAGKIERLYKLGIFEKAPSKKKWTFSKCKMAAKKYKTRNEWGRKAHSSYKIACQKGWLDRLCRHMISYKDQRVVWNKKKAHKVAKSYKIKKDWRIGHKASYKAAQQNGWIELFSKHMDQYRGKWTLKDCKKDAKKHKNKRSWSLQKKSGYHTALRKNWLDECCKHMLVKEPRMTQKKCIDAARKYKRFSDWARERPKMYSFMFDLGKIEKISKMRIFKRKRRPSKVWTYSDCRKDAKKYKKRIEWFRKDVSSYNAARKNGWMERLCKHMIPTSVLLLKWNKEKCKKKAAKYNHRNEWCEGHNSSYASAIRNGWLDELCSHMTRSDGVQREAVVVRKLKKMIEADLTEKVEIAKYLGRSAPDLTLYIEDSVFIVEVKHDESKWSKREIKRQINKYNKLGKKHYLNFKGVFLCSPKGRYGLSFSELLAKLIEIKGF